MRVCRSLPGYSTPGAPSAQAMAPPSEISATLSRPSVMAGRPLRDESLRVARHLTARSIASEASCWTFLPRRNSDLSSQQTTQWYAIPTLNPGKRSHRPLIGSSCAPSHAFGACKQPGIRHFLLASTLHTFLALHDAPRSRLGARHPNFTVSAAVEFKHRVQPATCPTAQPVAEADAPPPRRVYRDI